MVLIGEIGGTAKERAAEFIAREMSTPVVAVVAGRTALERVGALVARHLAEVAEVAVCPLDPVRERAESGLPA